ncbi:MAG TPA: ankyrin repeat domain-containing protein [Gammaproteobacteria bacterium]|nr:ankyrin repeat domain-containing protein [Gammaproteobacteria bacterium]
MPVRRSNLALVAALAAGIAFAAPQNAPPLIAAAEQGDRGAVGRLLDQGAPVDARAVDGTTALHWAVRADHLDLVRMLLESGADASAADRYGVTPLYLAAENGTAAVIAVLLDAGADLNAVAPIGETALMTAVRTGRLEAIELLIDRGASVDARDREFEQTALMLAVREGHPKVVELLLARSADVDARTRVGPTPRFVPPCKGTGCGSEGVGINRGGLPDRGRRGAALGGMTPLLYAARDGRVEEAQLLLAAGADVELAEANGMRPLLMALLNDQLAVADLLLDRGANVDADDFWGRTPLFAAVDYRNLDMNNRDQDSPTTNGVDRAPLLAMIAKLIERGANVNAQTREVPPSRRWLYSLGDVSWVDFTGQTPFLRAALSSDVAAMRLLLTHGADPNLPTQAGTTPLMAAAGVNWVVAQTYTESPQSSLEAIQLCLDQGADVNAANSMGLTAVLGAANRGANDIIRLLVANGARVDAVDKEGRNAVRWAEGVFLAAVGAERKPATIALLHELGAPPATGP